MNQLGRMLVEAGRTPGFRWVEVVGDAMQPTLYCGDGVGVAPVLSYTGEGLYLFEMAGEPAVYRCESDFRGGFTVWVDNPAYPTRHPCSRAEFQRTILGKVVVLFNVVDRALLEMGRAKA